MERDPLITYRRKPVSLDLAALESFAESLRKRVARGREFHCLVTNDIEMASLNQRFRNKPETTDVLSFPSDDPDRIGDIAVSLPRARRQAREFGHSPEDEVRILLLHGVLHLMGHDHETDSGQMQRAEQRWRRKLSLPAGLISRAGARAGECS